MKTKLVYLAVALALVIALSSMVVPTVVAQVDEDDPPYKYDPTSVSLSLYAGGNSSFSLDVAIPWGGVTPRDVHTGMGMKSVTHFVRYAQVVDIRSASQQVAEKA